MELINKDLVPVGAKVKYGTLCDAFGEEKLKGNSKKAQLKEMQRFIKLTQDGTWFIVEEHYNDVQDKVDGRKDNGKSETSLQALEEHRGHKQSYFDDDELPLAILWYLGLNSEKLVETNYVLANDLHLATGLCNEYYNLLHREKYTIIENSPYKKLSFDFAHKNIFTDMRSKTITALNQLQRQKVLDFAYWKVWFDNSRNAHICTDDEIKLIQEVQQDSLEWYLANNPQDAKFIHTVGDMYTKLHSNKIALVNEFQCNALKEHLKDFSYYTSCYKVIYTDRGIRKELIKRGFEVGTTKEEFQQCFKQHNEDIMQRVNAKFLQLQLDKLNKVYEEHLAVDMAYQQELEQFNKEYEESGRRGFGVKIGKPKPPRPSSTYLLQAYEEVTDILSVSVKIDLTDYECYMLQHIKVIIKDAKLDELRALLRKGDIDKQQFEHMFKIIEEQYK